MKFVFENTGVFEMWYFRFINRLKALGVKIFWAIEFQTFHVPELATMKTLKKFQDRPEKWHDSTRKSYIYVYHSAHQL